MKPWLAPPPSLGRSNLGHISWRRIKIVPRFRNSPVPTQRQFSVTSHLLAHNPRPQSTIFVSRFAQNRSRSASTETNMGSGEVKVGATGSASLTVTAADLASALAEGDGEAYPEVFATPRMIALMELAAGRILQPLLQDGQLSVGVGVEASHTAATLVGAKVEAVATYVGRQGKLYEFEVVATDPAGEIGRVKHTRAIVDLDRLMGAAKKRGGKSSL